MVGRAVPGEPPSAVTVCHGPSSVAAPFHTTGASGMFHCVRGGSSATFVQSGVPSL